MLSYREDSVEGGGEEERRLRCILAQSITLRMLSNCESDEPLEEGRERD